MTGTRAPIQPGYVSDGANRWPAVHRSDAARMVRLALEHAPAGSVVHGVAEGDIATREIAEMIAAQLGVPTASVAAADAHFGWIGRFFASDAPTSSALTRELLGWAPTGPTLAEDFAAGAHA